MNILHLLSQTELTGAEVYAQQLVRFQQTQGHRVFVISDRIHVPLATSWISLPISKSDFASRIILFFKLRKFFKQEKIDLVHCHSRGAVRHASPARWFLPIAQVTTVHGKQHSSWSKRWFDTYGEYKILICENLFRQFKVDFRIPPQSLRLLRNPFATEEMHFEKDLISTVRWAFIGRSSGPKGQRLRNFFDNGFFEYLRSHPDIEFDLIAAHPEKWGEDFLRKLRSLGSRVQVLSEVPNLKSHLKKYQTILAAGRVAMESLLTGIQVVGFGEAECLGLITPESFAGAIASNFGDIAEGKSQPVDAHFLIASLDQALKNPLDHSVRERLQKLVAQHYDSEHIQPLILDVYRSALFKRNTPAWIPVLMYHKIPAKKIQSAHRIFVTKEVFRKHLQFFHSRKFQTLTFSDLKLFWLGQKSYRLFPQKPLLLTFDDGYQDNLTHALPLLKEFQMKATIFLLSDHKILTNTWDLIAQTTDHRTSTEPTAQLMTLDEKKLIAGSGVFEIGSHGVDHLRLPTATDTEVMHQLLTSKMDLEKDLGVEVNSFAYPFGDIDPRLPTLARTAGYQFAVNTDQGGFSIDENPHSIFRVNIFPEDGFFQLWKKTSTWYRKYFYFKRRR